MFFSFDGVDGAGKTTQITQFVDWLRGLGHEVVVCRDPGGTGVGEQIRTLLLDPANSAMRRNAEMLLFMASRAQLVAEVIRPALAAGQIVVSDRFVLASLVFQGYAGGLELDSIRRVARVASDGMEPDLTFVLDLAPEEAAARIRRPRDRMELQGIEFERAVRAGFLREVELDPLRLVRIAADRPIDVVQQEIRTAATRILAGRPEPAR